MLDGHICRRTLKYRRLPEKHYQQVSQTKYTANIIFILNRQ